ncbi:MAG: hypothetical protein ACREUT_01725 [Steroidobacteraceae bacterium]
MSERAHYLKLLLIPLRPAALCTLIVLSAVLGVALKVGPFGLPLVFILMTWLFKYSFAFLDALVAGASEAPVLSMEMITGSMGELRSLVPLFLVALAFFASGAGRFWLGLAIETVVAAALLGCLPAVLAVQGWTGRLAYSLSPDTCRKFVQVLGRDYAWLVVCACVITAICVVVPAIGGAVPWVLRIALLIYAWLGLIAATGGTIRANRAELEREIPLIIPRLRAMSAQELERIREHWLDCIYAAWRNGAHSNAWRYVMERIEQSSEPLAELRWLYGRLADWQPPAFSNRLAGLLLPRLLRENRAGEALRVVRERLACDPGFRPQAEGECNRLLQLARQWGEQGLVDALLQGPAHGSGN